MKKKAPSIVPALLAFALLTLLAIPASASQMALSFAEVAQNADLIFVGTVSSQSCRFNATRTIIFTDVAFENVELIHASTTARQKRASTITITYPGGQIGDVGVSQCSAPTLRVGGRYVLFALDDGTVYDTPFVGGSQGQFDVVRDSETGTDYVLTEGGRAVLGMNGPELVASTDPVAEIRGGRLIADQSKTTSVRHSAELPRSANPALRATVSPRLAKSEGRPLTVDEFKQLIKETGLKASYEARLGKGRDGLFARRVNGKIVTEKIRNRTLKTRQLDRHATDGHSHPFDASNDKTQGAPLYTCGWWPNYLVMRTVPEDWEEYDVNNDCMATWNDILDLYRVSPSTGTYEADNGVSEFGGFAPDIPPAYEYEWGPSTLAVTLYWFNGGPDCGTRSLREADLFWNGNLNWTNDENLPFQDPSYWLLRPINMHELGHTWGYQTGQGETYDYDLPSVMHAGYRTVVETGRGLHAADAFYMRRNYDDRFWESNLDVGVESYYAENGLRPSSTSATTVHPNDVFQVRNVTLENMSTFPVLGFTVRFYLSTNNIISDQDSQIAEYYFDSYTAETVGRYDLDLGVPSNIPSGTYYLGAIVSRGYPEHFADDIPENNTTYWLQTITVQGGSTGGVTAPTNLTATAVSSSQINIGWGDASNNETGFIVERKTGSGSFGEIIRLGAGATSYQDTNLAASTTYTYRVAAFNSSATSPYSNEASATTSGTGGGCTSSTTAIVPNQTLNGSLDTNDCFGTVYTDRYHDKFTISATAGTAYTFSMTAGFDAFLVLKDPSGTFIDEDDDTSGTNPQIVFTASTNGVYTLEATSFSGGATGTYSVTLTATTSVTPPDITNMQAVVKPGKPVKVKISGSNLQAGALVYIGTSTTPWPTIKYKSTGLVVLKGDGLLNSFPVGVAVTVRIVNPNNGSDTFTYTRR
jgi:hypothetical protein